MIPKEVAEAITEATATAFEAGNSNTTTQGLIECSLRSNDAERALFLAIEKALADARDEALTKACEIVDRATFADGKIQMDGEDLEEEIRALKKGA